MDNRIGPNPTLENGFLTLLWTRGNGSGYKGRQLVIGIIITLSAQEEDIKAIDQKGEDIKAGE